MGNTVDIENAIRGVNNSRKIKKLIWKDGDIGEVSYSPDGNTIYVNWKNGDNLQMQTELFERDWLPRTASKRKEIIYA